VKLSHTLLVLGGRSELARAVVPLLQGGDQNYVVTRALQSEDRVKYLSKNFEIIDQTDSTPLFEDVNFALRQLPKRSDLDVLSVVSFSGSTDGRLLIDMTLAGVEQAITANFTFNAVWAIALIKRYMGKKVRFVFISSSPALRNMTGPGSTFYASSKHALRGLVAGISSEYGKFGVTANTMALGLTGIGMGRDLNRHDFERIASRTSTGKLVTADQVANAIDFLLCNDACVGAELTLDSGLS
jgi:NAD(P)-dependent dehydrogenase (short-subunit alcohol dehydrogenase family)